MLVNDNSNIQHARKLLWVFLLVFALGSLAYNWYQDTQMIRQFSADGIVIKVLPANEERAALLDIVSSDGQLRRLTHRDLLLPGDISPGDTFKKQAGSVAALVNHQSVLLQN